MPWVPSSTLQNKNKGASAFIHFNEMTNKNGNMIMAFHCSCKIFRYLLNRFKINICYHGGHLWISYKTYTCHIFNSPTLAVICFSVHTMFGFLGMSQAMTSAERQQKNYFV
jgi:hypothetical protein